MGLVRRSTVYHLRPAAGVEFYERLGADNTKVHQGAYGESEGGAGHYLQLSAQGLMSPSTG